MNRSGTAETDFFSKRCERLGGVDDSAFISTCKSRAVSVDLSVLTASWSSLIVSEGCSALIMSCSSCSVQVDGSILTLAPGNMGEMADGAQWRASLAPADVPTLIFVSYGDALSGERLKGVSCGSGLIQEWAPWSLGVEEAGEGVRWKVLLSEGFQKDASASSGYGSSSCHISSRCSNEMTVCSLWIK